jgi:hypothetical protein
MLNEKISYYIAKINSLKQEISFESEKIFQYENMLLSEKQKQESQNFFTKLFIENKCIISIDDILKVHHSRVENLSSSLEAEIDQFIKSGIQELNINEEELSNEEEVNLLYKNINYIETVSNMISECQNNYNKAMDILLIPLRREYSITNAQCKAAVDFLKFIIIKTKSCNDVISQYKLFEEDAEGIVHSINSVVAFYTILNSLDKYKDVQSHIHLFKSIEVNLKFLETTFNILKNVNKNKIEKIKEISKNNLINHKITFVNKLRDEYKLDLSAY